MVTVGPTKTIIELNGKKYDALTGQPLDESSAPSLPKQKIAEARGRSVDGMWFSGQKRAEATKRILKPLKRKPQKAATLMRSAVKNPAKPKPAPANTSFDVRKPLNNRLGRAKEVGRSNFIGHFKSQASSGATADKTPQPPVGRAMAAVASLAPAVSIAAPLKQGKERFDQALAKATSHTHKAPKKGRLHHRVAKHLGVRPRTVRVTTLVIAGLIFSGVFVYQNLPNFAIKVAAARAGFHATLPAYHPSGFSIDGFIHYKNGQVTLNYHSASDTRSYSVVQAPSEWSSESLLTNYVNKTNKQYQTFQDSGKTIFIYDGANATWVDGGVWYRVISSSSLSSDQLLGIANSL